MRSSNKKKYCILSSSRADFGILSNFIKKFSKKKKYKSRFNIDWDALFKKIWRNQERSI